MTHVDHVRPRYHADDRSFIRVTDARIGKEPVTLDLFPDASPELGHTKLTKKVLSALNRAFNVERNKGRLKTD